LAVLSLVIINHIKGKHIAKGMRLVVNNLGKDSLISLAEGGWGCIFLVKLVIFFYYSIMNSYLT